MKEAVEATTARTGSALKKRLPRKLPVWLGIAVLAVAALAAFVLIAKPSVTFNGGAKAVAEMTDEERMAFAEKAKAQAGKLLLMTAETPEIIEAAADNLGELLAQGGFWKNLERGDLILVFSEDPRVVIWRPSKKLIVNVGPIINDADGAEALPGPAESTE